MNTPQISIIVPVYKVEPYLHKCLDSIVNQTYSNLEIILVDDGSPDNCGKICDTYAAKDARIHVIHKPNGGVSSARNAGLAATTGDWIGWVDSDDWIEPEMFAHMLERAVRYHADIAACGQIVECRDHATVHGWAQEQVMDSKQAIELLLQNDLMRNSMWDKLWRRELFEGILFPVGQTYEDIAVVHQLFARSNITVCVPQPFYHYVQRSDGIMGGGTLDSRINYYRAAKRRLEEMQSQWPQFQHLMEAQCIASAVTCWCGYYSSPKEERKALIAELKDISSFSKQRYRLALRYMKLGLMGRAVARLIPYPTWWAFALSGFCGRLYQLKHGRRL